MRALPAPLLPFAGCATMVVICARAMRGGKSSPDPANAGRVAELPAEVVELCAPLDSTAELDAEPHAARRRAIVAAPIRWHPRPLARGEQLNMFRSLHCSAAA